jgi:ABC-2 type transport system permease protein
VLAALISAIANSAVMLVGMVFYIGGMVSGTAGEEISAADLGSLAGTVELSAGQAMTELGFALSPVSYILFGIQLFLTIAIGLSIALILGAMATDMKSLGTLLLPLMMAVMLPWFIVMFTDVNAAPPVFGVLVYLVPFTHAYMSLPNLMEGNALLSVGGIVYQTLFLLVCMYLAVKMFTTDKLFTVSFNPDASKRKKRGKKGEAEAAESDM